MPLKSFEYSSCCSIGCASDAKLGVGPRGLGPQGRTLTRLNRDTDNRWTRGSDVPANAVLLTY